MPEHLANSYHPSPSVARLYQHVLRHLLERGLQVCSVGVDAQVVPPVADNIHLSREVLIPDLMAQLERLASRTQRLLDALLLGRQPLAQRLGWSRPRDVRRRYLEALAELGLVEARGHVWAISDGYLERQGEIRGDKYSTVQLRARRARSAEGLTVTFVAESGVVASEDERLRLDRKRHERERGAFRRLLALSGPEADEACRALLNVLDEERETPNDKIADLQRITGANLELVEVLRSYLDRNIHRRVETASWLSVALWADGYLPYKPTPEAVGQALAEVEMVAA
jgi:hypothetical protein